MHAWRVASNHGGMQRLGVRSGGKVTSRHACLLMPIKEGSFGKGRHSFLRGKFLLAKASCTWNSSRASGDGRFLPCLIFRERNDEWQHSMMNG
jgi:hypothetical protein